jgi:tetratricopeptide (TPR) repeat protein
VRLSGEAKAIGGRMKSCAVFFAGAMLSAVLAPAATWAVGVDLSESEDSPALAAVRAKIKAEDYRGALADLRGMKPDADVYNLMGYSLRKSGDMAEALVYYEKALDIDPRHRGALEYLGELYVETGQLDKAREKADILRKICPSGCEELADLDRAIAQPRSASNARRAW